MFAYSSRGVNATRIVASSSPIAQHPECRFDYSGTGAAARKTRVSSNMDGTSIRKVPRTPSTRPKTHRMNRIDGRVENEQTYTRTYMPSSHLS
eukprot:CAMPEP_0113583526 /NCGR_PEP_ID=MMETSP0015_2-20120614/32571_1 /TAXON_ID=2838 /ORGANISM="Odontella" /LENGTH=92 /DNA_ID=CAMNT_0000488423 /DNA_START=90 /DNA_END=365 /DNA_ORIENTATION=- /assembly_acc=CAM_ASM_000160